MSKPLDRSEAVNLARNAWEDEDLTITVAGIRKLAGAVLAMDVELTRLYSAQPEVERRYTLNELRAVAARTVIPQDMHERSALLMLIAALGDPDDVAPPQNGSFK